MLKFVELPIRRAEGEEPGPDIQAIIDAAAHRIPGHNRLAGNLVAGVQRREIYGRLGPPGCARGVRADREIVRRRVASRGSVSKIEEARPQIGEPWVPVAVFFRLV